MEDTAYNENKPLEMINKSKYMQDLHIYKECYYNYKDMIIC